MILKEVFSIETLPNHDLLLEYNDGTTRIVTPVTIATREQAIVLCNAMTKNALKKPDAFERLNDFKNDFSQLRNYEIEEYLTELSGSVYYRIIEVCPFNGFSSY